MSRPFSLSDPKPDDFKSLRLLRAEEVTKCDRSGWPSTVRILERRVQDLGVPVAGYVRNQARDPMEFSEVAADLVTSVPTSAKRQSPKPSKLWRLIKIM